MAGPTDTTRRQRAAARPRLLAALQAAGTLPCPRCHQPMTPQQPLQVGHATDVADGGTNSHLRLEHQRCNQQAGGRRGRTGPTPTTHYSRQW